MAGIDEVLERLVADGDFRAALARDPAAALAAYDLTREDVELLASQLDDGDDAERAVEQRTSKSAMLAMLSSLSFGGAGDDALAEVKAKSWSWGEVKGDGAVPDDLAASDDETALWELKNAHISSYQTGGSGGDVVPDGVAPDDLAAPEDGELGDKPDQIDVLSWSWGETSGDDAAVPDDLAAPEDNGELYNKSKGHVDYSWKIEEGMKAEVEMDDLTHKVDEGIEEQYSFTYGKVTFDPVHAADAADDDLVGVNPPDDGLGGAGDEQGIIIVGGKDGAPGGGGEEGIIIVNSKDDAPGDADEQGIIVVDTKSGQVGGNPPDDGIVGGTPPDDGIVGGTPPDDSVVGSTPGSGVGDDADEQGIIVINGKEDEPSGIPSAGEVQGGPIMETDDSNVGAITPDDSNVGATTPDDGIVGIVPPDDGISQELQVEPDALNEALADEVLEIEDA